MTDFIALPERMRLELLRDVIRASESIRAYDLKAEIGMICFVLSVEAIHVLFDLAKLKAAHPGTALVLFMLFVAALVG